MSQDTAPGLVGTVLLLAACQPQEEAPPSAATTPAPLDTVILQTSRGRLVIELIRERAAIVDRATGIIDAMIDDVSTWLEARHVSISRVHRECFFNSTYST